MLKRLAIFSQKIDKVDTTIEFCIFELVFVSNYTLNNFEFFGPNFPKKYICGQKRKSEHHHWIPLIQILLGTKFQLKLTILIFLTRFTQKGFFWSKTEKVNTRYFLHNSVYSNFSSARFQLKLTILIFWVKLAQKGISGQKLKKLTSSLNSLYSNKSLGSKFLL